MQYTVIACVLNILSIINDCIDILKSGKFFASSNTVRSRKGARCFVGFAGLPEPQESQIRRHSSSFAQMNPICRAPADAIESYAAAGYFSGNRILHTKRELRHFFSCRRSFCPLRPPPHPAVKQSPSRHIAPASGRSAISRHPYRERFSTKPSFHSALYKKRQPRRGLPQIFRVGGITASQALFRRP